MSSRKTKEGQATIHLRCSFDIINYSFRNLLVNTFVFNRSECIQEKDEKLHNDVNVHTIFIK